MKGWLMEKIFRIENAHADDIMDWYAGEPTSYLEESVAYSSFLASGVAGVEEVSFAEFLRMFRAGRKASEPIDEK
jgi:hypothetical protein